MTIDISSSLSAEPHEGSASEATCRGDARDRADTRIAGIEKQPICKYIHSKKVNKPFRNPEVIKNGGCDPECSGLIAPSSTVFLFLLVRIQLLPVWEYGGFSVPSVWLFSQFPALISAKISSSFLRPNSKVATFNLFNVTFVKQVQKY